MFKVITAPFHPILELTLVRDIQQLKSTDPLAPIAIVVPSEPLRRRLQWVLCVEQHCSLFDVHFLTFHQLALRLYHEQVLFNQGKGFQRLALVHDLCFEYLLSSLMKEHPTLFEGLSATRFTNGTGKALWRTIQDLKEAMVDPDIALEGVKEGLFGNDERRKLENLFTAYAMVQEVSRSLKIGSADDLASLMIPWVEHSGFLSRINRVCYYGFYDLTQVQLSLFEAVTQKSRVIVYFPLSKGAAFSFARKFWERHLSSGDQSHRCEEDELADVLPGAGHSESQKIMVLNTIGPEDELAVVCKEIMKLVEQHHYHYEDIGIVVRDLKPYQSSMRRVFEQHRIPFTSSAMMPVIREPLIKHLIQLSSLPLNNFFWRDVLDILTSPFFRLERFGLTSEDIQPELWHKAVRTLGIHRGQDQWSQLALRLQIGMKGGNGRSPLSGVNNDADIDLKQIQLLERFVTELIADCVALPTQGTIGDLTKAFWSLAKNYLAFPGSVKSSLEDIQENPDQAELSEAIQQVLIILQEMQVVYEVLTWEQWVQLFFRAVKACSITLEPDLHHGVRVLDAMSARGLPFQVLFLMGLNEKVFPRFIREDGLLRDRSRRVLEETFGYKIDEKLKGYEEEQLLFALLAQAARKRFYLVYQRADKEGRPLAPSPYLTEHLSPLGELKPYPEIVIPRRWSDRFNHPLFDSRFLTGEELGLKLIYEGYDPGELLEKTEREPQLFQNGWEFLQKIEGQGRRWGSYDGIIESPETYWKELVQKGITPTSLEVYARCPFQYFARRVLGASRSRAEMLEELPASSLGDLCHVVLHHTYRQLMEDGWPEQQTALLSLKEKIVVVAEDVFRRYQAGSATGYFLTWQLTKDVIIQLVASAVEADRQAFCQYGFRPVAFEVDAEGQLTTLGAPFAHLKIRGRLDRVDFRSDPPSVRIVDYKFQGGSRMRSRDRDLLLGGIRGSRLQPPLYVLMNRFHDRQLKVKMDDPAIKPQGVDFVYLAPRLETQITRAEFETSFWKGASGRQLKNTIRKLLQGIQGGQFFILPGEYCRHCDASVACRRYHRPTWVRSYRAPQARQLRQLQAQDRNGD